MKKIVMATAIALVAGTPLAFAKPTPISSLELSTMHCGQAEQAITQDRAAYKSYSDFLVAKQNALSVCHQAKNSNDKAHGGLARS
ncbi:G protein-coupled receptor family protein [Dongia deserti]|uniref:hypothetical protein n=1 Tax=Dongia deserti TaxID=2268030 RepID=UPI000E6579D4|nr:hypothetical protein [Dongia deserti]